MAAPKDATVVTCTNNSDYAVICSFFEQFGDKSGLLFPSFQDLQQMLENVEEVAYPLIELHVKLMRKLKKSVNFDRWEKAAAKYAHTYSDQDGWEIERFGYKKISLAVKLRLLKNLLEAQFDGNIKFKNEINKVTSDELRLQPIGKDIQGRRYWHLLDDDCNLRVYREDLDEETWDLVSSDKESMVKLIEQLSAHKEFTEEEGTSPATSEESCTNGQEDYLRVESENKVHQSTDGPSETKRPKVELVEDTAATVTMQEPIIGEAIESPVLLVKGEGNGADCDTGNPGEEKSDETCESKDEQGKTDDKSAIDCESDRLKSCVGSSESFVNVQPKTKTSDTVPESAFQTSSSVQNDLEETSLVQLNSETSVESNSVELPPVSEDCSEARTVLNSPEKLNPLTSITESTAVSLPTNEHSSSKESGVFCGESNILPTLEDVTKPNSIDIPPTEVGASSNHQEDTEVSNVISSKSEDETDTSIVTNVSNPVEPSKLTETPKSKTPVNFSVVQEPVPETVCPLGEVRLDPLPPESLSEVKPVDSIPKDLVSREQSNLTSDSDIVISDLSPCSISVSVEETKQPVESVLVPVTEEIPSAALEEEKLPEMEKSHSEQIAESETKEESLSTTLEGKADVTESEIKKPNSPSPESQEFVMDEKTIGSSLVKTVASETIAVPVAITDVPEENLIQETKIIAENSCCATELSNTFPSENVNESSTPPAIKSEVNLEVASNSLESRDPSHSLLETNKSSEGALIVNDVVNEPFKNVENTLIQPVLVSHTDSVTEPVHPISENSSPDLAIDAESTMVPNVKKESPLHIPAEMESCSHSFKSQSEQLVEHPITSSESPIDSVNESVTSKSSSVPDEVTAHSVPKSTLYHESASIEPAATVEEIPKVLEKDLVPVESEIIQCSIPTFLHDEVLEETETSQNQPERDVREIVENKEAAAILEMPLKKESIETELKVRYEGVVTDQVKGNDNISSFALKEESVLTVEDPVSNLNPEVPQKSEAKQIESEELKNVTTTIASNEDVTSPKASDELVVLDVKPKSELTIVEHEIPKGIEDIPTSAPEVEKISSQIHHELMPDSNQDAKKIDLAEKLEANSISSISSEKELPAPQFHDELEADSTLKVVQKNEPEPLVAEAIVESSHITIKREESVSAVNVANISIVTDAIPENFDNNVVGCVSISESNVIVDKTTKLTTSPKSLLLPIEEDTPRFPTSPVQNNKELRDTSEVIRSNSTDDALPSTTISDTPLNVDLEDKPTTLPDADKSSLNQLTFDFDASAPVPIILPPSRKPVDNSAKRGRGRKRGRQGGEEDSGKENDAQPLVLRQSSRIAKLREKEDEERRKQEADRLQRLKDEHELREKRRAARDERMKKMEEKQQRRQQKTTTREEVAYKSEEESSSSEEDEEDSRKKGKKRKKKLLKKKNDRPWDSTDSSEKSSESEEDGLEDLQVEEENEELVFKSDHEFSPESDLDDEPVQPRKHARTARAGTVPKKRSRSKKVKIEEVEEEEVATEEEDEDEDEEKEANCHKCGQSDHPEWILLCDRCDAGWHANCVKPPLMVIPEGNWFCPPCDHVALLERLQERLEAYEFLLQEKEAELERKKEQELEAKLAREEEEKQALEEMEAEIPEEDDEDEGNSVGDLGVDGEGVEDEETSEESGEDEDEEDDEEGSQNESDENLNGRRQRKAAKQANYSFKDFDDMIKSALRDDGEEEEEESGKGKGKGKGMREDEKSDEDESKPRSPPGVRPSGIGNKRISTSDDDSDVMPQVLRKKKARKLNDLSATSNEDDSDEDFQGSSAEGSDSEEDDEEASDSGDSFVVDDDSDDDDVIHVRAKPKARAASPTIRRSTRSARKRNIRMDSSDTSEEESEYEISNKRKRGNESWDSSGASSSDASWGRSKKRRSAPKGRAKPVAPPKPKPKPPPRKTPANRGRGRGGRTNKLESDDEDKPFRSNVSVKKIKEARPVPQDDEDSDHAQRRTTRGRQISYKELISSGESGEESGSTVKKMGTLFAADRNKSNAGAAVRGGASRRGRGGVTTPAGRGNVSGGDNTPVPISVISSSRAGTLTALNQDDESRFSGSTDTLEFSTAAAAAAVAAASVYTTGDESHTSNDVLPPSIDPELAPLPIILPQEGEVSPLIKDELPSSVPVSALSQDLQVSRLIQQRPVVEIPPPILPPDLQINRLISSQSISSSSNSPARQSPGILPQQRLIRDALESQTPPPAVTQLPLPVTTIPPLQPVVAPSVDLPLYSHSGVIKATRHSLPPTPPLYSGPHVVKATDLIASSTPPSVIRPYPTTATSSSLSQSVSGNTPGNPLSIQGLLGTSHVGSPGPTSSAPPHPGSHIRPYGNTSHMIGHGPFLNHTPYGSPYSAVPPSRSSYMGTPVTPTPRPAYSPMYPTPHMPPHPGLPLHSPYQHHGPPLRPTSSYQHAGFPQAFAAAAAAAASAEEERRIYRVVQASREAGADNFDPATGAGLILKAGIDDPSQPPTAVPPESEFGGLVSYFSSQQEDFEES